MPTSRYVYVADSQTEGAGEGLWVKTDIRVGFHFLLILKKSLWVKTDIGVGFHLQHNFHLLLASDPLYLFCNVLCSKVILSGGSDRCGLQRAETEGPARGQVWRQDLVRLQDQVSLMDFKKGFLTPVCPAAARRSTWTLARRRRACPTTEPPLRTSVATPSSQMPTLHNSGIQCE